MARSSGPAAADDERTVRIARRQFARRQWARRWLAWRTGLVAGLGLVAVVGVLWLLYFSSVFAVSTVQVDGNVVLSARQVRRAAAVPVGQPLASVDLGAVAARVRKLTAVQSVEVARSWPHAVRIDVHERAPVAVVRRAGVLRGLAADGVLFRRFAGRPANLPLVRAGSHTRTDALAEAAKVVRALPADLVAKVAHVDVRTIDDISLRLRDGRTVLWGSADRSADKAKVLVVLLTHKARFYDVTVPSRPAIRR
jgi:cell division protein FtsQ